MVVVVMGGEYKKFILEASAHSFGDARVCYGNGEVGQVKAGHPEPRTEVPMPIMVKGLPDGGHK
jgi:hypothetical protein